MKRYPLLPMVLLASVLAGKAAAADPGPPPNTLTDAEKAAGWKLLFDGNTTAGWRNFKKPALTTTNGWVVQDGWLKKAAKARGGDIISTNQYLNFELQWEWRIPAKANNGVKYFITEQRSSAIGHEYQMIDDATVKAGKSKTASFYDVLPPKEHRPIKLAPEFNVSRVLVQGNHVEHWLNGEKVLEYECGSEEVKTAVAASKFKTVPGFGTPIKGHILLTDHNDEASFRNLKLRELPAPSK
jgi:hypothetical protein